MNRGLILAGGLATRLPNKPLLPLRNHKPVITSSIDFFIRSKITPISIVIPSNSIIPLIVKHYYPNEPIEYLVQEVPLGVPMAISQLLPDTALGFEDRVIVAFCDNVYSVELEDPKPIGHTVMAIDDPIKSGALTWYRGRQLAGWMQLDRDAIQWAHHYQDTLEFLKKIDGEAIVIHDPNWWDIGTIKTYEEYWK